jgi:hypothetical protein
VSGKVFYKDKALPSGKISFVGADGKEYRSSIKEGRYMIPKAPPGPVIIAVVTRVRPGMPVQIPVGFKKSPGGQPLNREEIARPDVVEIPDIYYSAETSEIVKEVRPGPQVINIVLPP